MAIRAVVCARLDVRPHETVFVDDTELCVTGAREAGLQAIRFQDNAQAIAELDFVLRRRDAVYG